MRYGVLGTGMVGQTLATRLVALGHDVTMGSRIIGNEAAIAWARDTGGTAGTFANAARAADVVINATAGAVSLDALAAAGAEHLDGKVLVDVANPIQPGSGMPPQLAFCNDDSLGERIQRAYPRARVVKTLNTVNASIMVEPHLIAGDHAVFVCGDDPEAKDVVKQMLGEFGWRPSAVLDLGGIEASRGVEMYLAFWLRLMLATGTPRLNVAVRTG